MAFKPVTGSTKTYITQGETVGTVTLNTAGPVVRVINAGAQPAWVEFGASSPVPASYLSLFVPASTAINLDRCKANDLYVGVLSSATAQTTLYFTTGWETEGA